MDTERLIKHFGEEYRGLIEKAIEYLDQQDYRDQINRVLYIKELIERIVKIEQRS